MISWVEHLLKNGLEHYGLLAVFITMALESACVPLPSEVVMPWAGYLAATGHFGLIPATVVGALANLTGSWLAYVAGRFGGRSFIDKYGSYVLLSKNHLRSANGWFAKKGELTVFISRMLPGVRTFISLPAGIAKMDFVRFSIYSFAGSLPWNFTLVYLGFSFTNRWSQLQNYLKEFNVLVFAGLTLIVLLYFIWKNKIRSEPEGKLPR